jgi:hypothetical protein
MLQGLPSTKAGAVIGVRPPGLVHLHRRVDGEAGGGLVVAPRSWTSHDVKRYHSAIQATDAFSGSSRGYP